MIGNVLEWCADFPGAYKAEDAVDPTGAASGETRALRGGSWVHEATSVRSAARQQTVSYDEYHVAGFRLVAAAAAP